jgi:hypothetical protein
LHLARSAERSRQIQRLETLVDDKHDSSHELTVLAQADGVNATMPTIRARALPPQGPRPASAVLVELAAADGAINGTG